VFTFNSNHLKYNKTPFDLNQSCIKFGFVAELKTQVFLLLQISDQVTWVNPLKRLPNLIEICISKISQSIPNKLLVHNRYKVRDDSAFLELIQLNTNSKQILF
jgi:hypothetical protein